MLDAAAAGIPGVVTFAPLYEADEPPDRPNLRQRLRAIADEHGMAMCGGNGMGFINMESGVRACGFLTADYMLHGPVALLSHSGSAFNAFAFNQRDIGFNLVVSSGQEIVSTMADYMEYVLGLESTTRARAAPGDGARPREVRRDARPGGGARHPGPRAQDGADRGGARDGGRALRGARR